MVYLTHDPIDYTRLMEKVRHPSAGGVVTFLGTVRDITGVEITSALEYEAFGPMAESLLERIAQEAREQWKLFGLEILHRLGFLKVGEISIAVAVSAPHRAAAFQACQFVVDRVKLEAPIWKKDHSPTGQSNWVHPGLRKSPLEKEQTSKGPGLT
ncbi:MAG: molybdenum cofactor biosynthesis protein MoaE [Gemmataceae bacterium]|nr:molybdenum cofactor biosynthesis protein MoaE [Gemmataceae bacterium]